MSAPGPDSQRVVEWAYGSDIPADRLRTMREIPLYRLDPETFRANYRYRLGAAPPPYWTGMHYDATSEAVETVTVMRDSPFHIEMHEYVHTAQNPYFKRLLGRELNEGFTEFYTRAVTEPRGLAVPSEPLARGWVGVAGDIQTLTGTSAATRDLARKAFFGEGVDPIAQLVEAVDARTAPGTFLRVRDLVIAGRVAEARSLLLPLLSATAPIPPPMPTPGADAPPPAASGGGASPPSPPAVQAAPEGGPGGQGTVRYETFEPAPEGPTGAGETQILEPVAAAPDPASDTLGEAATGPGETQLIEPSTAAGDATPRVAAEKAGRGASAAPGRQENEVVQRPVADPGQREPTTPTGTIGEQRPPAQPQTTPTGTVIEQRPVAQPRTTPTGTVIEQRPIGVDVAGEVARIREQLAAQPPAPGVVAAPTGEPPLDVGRLDGAAELAAAHHLDVSTPSHQFLARPEAEVINIGNDLWERMVRRRGDLYHLDVDERLEISRRALVDAEGLPGQAKIIEEHRLQRLDLSRPVEDQLPRSMTAQEKDIFSRNLQRAAEKSIDLRLQQGEMVEVPFRGETDRLVTEALVRGKAAELDPRIRSTPEYRDVAERLRSRFQDGFEWHRDAFRTELERGVVKELVEGDHLTYHPLATADDRALLRKVAGLATPEDLAVIEQSMARPEPSPRPEIAELFAGRTGTESAGPAPVDRPPELAAKAETVDVPATSPREADSERAGGDSSSLERAIFGDELESGEAVATGASAVEEPVAGSGATGSPRTGGSESATQIRPVVEGEPATSPLSPGGDTPAAPTGAAPSPTGESGATGPAGGRPGEPAATPTGAGGAGSVESGPSPTGEGAPSSGPAPGTPEPAPAPTGAGSGSAAKPAPAPTGAGSGPAPKPTPAPTGGGGPIAKPAPAPTGAGSSPSSAPAVRPGTPAPSPQGPAPTPTGGPTSEPAASPAPPDAGSATSGVRPGDPAQIPASGTSDPRGPIPAAGADLVPDTGAPARPSGLLEPQFGAHPGVSGEIPLPDTPDAPKVSPPEPLDPGGVVTEPPPAQPSQPQAIAPPKSEPIDIAPPRPPEVIEAPPEPRPAPAAGGRDGAAPRPDAGATGGVEGGAKGGGTTAGQASGGGGGAGGDVSPRPGGGRPSGSEVEKPKGTTEEPEAPKPLEGKGDQGKGTSSKGETATGGEGSGASSRPVFNPGEPSQVMAKQWLEEQGFTDITITQSGDRIHMTATGPDGTPVSATFDKALLKRGTTGSRAIEGIKSGASKVLHTAMLLMLAADMVHTAWDLAKPETTLQVIEAFARLLDSASSPSGMWNAEVDGYLFMEKLESLFGVMIRGLPTHPLWISLIKEVGGISLGYYLSEQCDKAAMGELARQLKWWVYVQREKAKGNVITGGPPIPLAWKPGPRIDETQLGGRGEGRRGRTRTGPPPPPRDTTFDHLTPTQIREKLRELRYELAKTETEIRQLRQELAEALARVASLSADPTGNARSIEFWQGAIGVIAAALKKAEALPEELKSRIATGVGALPAGEPDYIDEDSPKAVRDKAAAAAAAEATGQAPQPAAQTPSDEQGRVVQGAGDMAAGGAGALLGRTPTAAPDQPVYDSPPSAPQAFGDLAAGGGAAVLGRSSTGTPPAGAPPGTPPTAGEPGTSVPPHSPPSTGATGQDAAPAQAPGTGPSQPTTAPPPGSTPGSSTAPPTGSAVPGSAGGAPPTPLQGLQDQVAGTSPDPPARPDTSDADRAREALQPSPGAGASAPAAPTPTGPAADPPGASGGPPGQAPPVAPGGKPPGAPVGPPGAPPPGGPAPTGPAKPGPLGGGAPPPVPPPPDPPPAPPDLPPAPRDAPPTPGSTGRRPRVLVGGGAIVIGLGLGLLGGHNLFAGGSSTQQPTAAVAQVGAVSQSPSSAPTTAPEPPPVISGITAQANSNESQTTYAAAVTGPGPITFTWGWAVDPGCGFLDTSIHGPTTFSALGPCPPPAEAKAAVLACAQGPTGVSVARRRARFGDLGGQTNPLLVEQGLGSEGFTEAHGTGDCASIVASGGKVGPGAEPGPPPAIPSTQPLLADTLPAANIQQATTTTSSSGSTVTNSALVAGGLLLAIGPFLVHLRHRPKKPFVNKCDAPPCHGCPRSEQCDRELVFASQAYAQSVFDHEQSKARLQAAEAYEAACRDYWLRVTAYLNQLQAIVPQMQAYVTALEQYIASLQRALKLDEQLLSLHGIPAADLSWGPKHGFVKLTDSLWAKDHATAAAAAGAPGAKSSTSSRWPFEFPPPAGAVHTDKSGSWKFEYPPPVLAAQSSTLATARTALDAIAPAHLSTAEQPGWVKVFDNLYAKDQHTANMARAAGGVDPMQVTLDWAWKNTLLIGAKNNLDTARADLTKYQDALRDVQTKQLPDAETRFDKSVTDLRRAQDDEREKAATEAANKQNLDRAKETQAACRAILKAQIEAWLAAEAASS